MLEVDIKGRRGGFDLDVWFKVQGGVAALFGPSGAGKTSILRAISGLWTPDSGRVTLDNQVLWGENGQNVPVFKRRIGAVFQAPLLFPHMSVRKNLLYSKPSGSAVFNEVVAMLDLENLLGRMPRNLSGGEAQRVALGRALISEPKLLLLDEPLTGLDEMRRESVFPYLERMCESAKIPVIYVSHNRAEIERLARRVLMIDSGRIIGDISVGEFAEQAN